MTRVSWVFLNAMNRWIAAALFSASAAQAQEMLRIDRAIDLALTRNERAKIADSNVTVTAAAVQRATGAFLPTLILLANDTQRPDDIVRAGNPSNVANASVTLNQPIFVATAFPLLGQARQNHEGQIAQTTDDKRALAFDAAHAFIAVLVADEVVRAAERKLETAKANLADTQARVDAQLASTNDVTRSQIDLASSERELALDKGITQNAYISLVFTINAPVSGVVRPEDLLKEAVVPAPSADGLVSFAIDRRPDLVARKRAALAAHDFAQEPLLRLVPTVNLTGQFSATSNLPTLMGVTAHWNDEFLGVSIAWPIFDAGIRYADKRSRDALASIADLNTETTVRAIDAQVRSAVATLASSQAALASSERAMIAAQLSVSETAILYRHGLVRAIELIDAAETRFLAEVNYASAEYAALSAYLSLRQAMGLDPIGVGLR